MGSCVRRSLPLERKDTFLYWHRFRTGGRRSGGFISTYLDRQRQTTLATQQLSRCLRYHNGICCYHRTQCGLERIEDHSDIFTIKRPNSCWGLLSAHQPALWWCIQWWLEVPNLPPLDASLWVAETVSMVIIPEVGLINWLILEAWSAGGAMLIQ